MSEQQPGDGLPPAPALTIDVGGTSRTVQPGDDAVTIGREPPAQILLAAPGVSRAHLRIQYDRDHWSLTDTASRNGTFLDGERIQQLDVTTTVTVHLGNPQGIALHLVPQHDAAADLVAHPHGGANLDGGADDAATARAGTAVQQRREELGLSCSTLVTDVMAPADYERFEAGQAWPDPDAQRVLEQRLAWPAGAIAALRDGADVPEQDVTDLLSPTVRVEVVLDAAEIEVRAIRRRIPGLPAPADPRFLRELAPLLTQLRRLDRLGTAAARTTTGRPEVAAALAGVRGTRAELLRHAARSPHASLAQRLGAARHHGHLTVAEVAAAAGVTIADVEAAERDDTPSAAVRDALERVVTAVDDGLRAHD